MNNQPSRTIPLNLITSNWLLFLAGITIFAAVLRFYQLGEWSFWEDEMFTIGGNEDGFNTTFLRQSLASLAMQTLVTYAPQGMIEWYARLVPAVVGTLSVPILFFPLRRIFDELTALTAVALLTISPWHLYWSQNARFYTLLLLFYTLAIAFFYLGLHRNKPVYLLFSVIFLILAVKERLLALFFVPIVLIYLLLLLLLPIENPKGVSWSKLLIFLIPTGVAGLFFVAPYATDFAGWMRGFGYANNSSLSVGSSIIYYVGIPTMVMAGVGTWLGWRQKDTAVLLFAISALVPPLILMVIAPFHYTASRYAFHSLMGWQVVAAVAIIAAVRQLWDHSILLALGVALLLLAPSIADDFFYFQYQNGNRSDWRGAFAFIQSSKGEGEMVYSRNPELADFYLGTPTSQIYNLDENLFSSQDQKAWFVEDVVTAQVDPDLHLWLVDHAQLKAVYDVTLQGKTFEMRVYFYQPE